MRAVIVIPTYNEAENIVPLIQSIQNFHPDFDILVVDDNSPDGTAALVEKLFNADGHVRVLRRSAKAGLGRAYVAGFLKVLSIRPSYDLIIQMDADFSHHPVYLREFVEAAKDNDVSIGSRYVRGGGIVDWNMGRRALSYGANLFIRLFIGHAIKDCTSGFRCFRREALQGLHMETVWSNGYFFQVEVLNRCLKAGYRIIETPIIFTDRKKGVSKLGLREIREALRGIPTFVRPQKKSG